MLDILQHLSTASVATLCRHQSKYRFAILVVAALLGAMPTAHADIITFNNLSGPQAQIVSTYMEGNYTVTSSSGTWGESHLFGNGVPAIFSSSPSASVDVTRTGGGTFNFNSVDLGNGGYGMPNFVIVGFLSGNAVFGLSSSLIAPNTFSTVPSYNTSLQMDTLRISLNQSDGSTYLIDNINIGVVPEPSSFALLGVALSTILFRFGRRA